jgi:ribonuclease G
MYREILINVETQEKRVAILENKSLEEFYVERKGIQRLVGNIYKGVVETLVPAIGAAFVRMGVEKNGFLYVQDLTQPDYEKIAEVIEKPYNYEALTEKADEAKEQLNIKDMLKVGQEILVQVVKEPLGTKGARVTTHISLPGRYLVLIPCDHHFGISRKIQDHKERARLKSLLKDLNVPQNMGLIVRTAGNGCTKRQFFQDLRYLGNLWRKIKMQTQKKSAPALVHEEYDLILRTIRDNFTAQTNKLFVDSKEEYKRIMHFLRFFSPNLRSRVQLYRMDVPLFEKKEVEDEIAKIYTRKVFLESGGYIVIEPTEGLVAIDVNSGRFTGKKDPEETAYLVNLEAAKEIARQLRLRDIGGIIIIDFIDMKLAKHRRKVFDVLSAAVKRDHAKTVISSVSEFGLIEMTRQRMRKSLESVVYQSCPYCQGKGLVKSADTMAILVLRKIQKILQKINKKTILVLTHPDVAFQLVNENRQAIYNLENSRKVKILVRQNASLHREEFNIELV